MVKYFVPAFRALIAKELVEKHGLSQVEAAKKLGITQAAISQYIHQKRGRKTMLKLRKIPEVNQLVSTIASRLASSEEASLDDLSKELCNLCGRIRAMLSELIQE